MILLRVPAAYMSTNPMPNDLKRQNLPQVQNLREVIGTTYGACSILKESIHY